MNLNPSLKVKLSAVVETNSMQQQGSCNGRSLAMRRSKDQSRLHLSESYLRSFTRTHHLFEQIGNLEDKIPLQIHFTAGHSFCMDSVAITRNKMFHEARSHELRSVHKLLNNCSGTLRGEGIKTRFDEKQVC